VRNAQDGYWQLDIREIRVDGQSIDFCVDGGCRGIVDSSSSHLGVPAEVLPQLEGLMAMADVGGRALISSPTLGLVWPHNCLTGSHSALL